MLVGAISQKYAFLLITCIAILQSNIFIGFYKTIFFPSFNKDYTNMLENFRTNFGKSTHELINVFFVKINELRNLKGAIDEDFKT